MRFAGYLVLGTLLFLSFVYPALSERRFVSGVNVFDIDFSTLPRGPNIGYFWQITDPHIDRKYLIGGNPDCGFPLCCRDTSANQTRKAGRFGDYKCDIPPETFQATLDFVRDFPIEPDFLIYTGDDVPHDIWEQTEEYNFEYVEFARRMVIKTLPGLRIFPTIGNHDPFPVDQLDVPPRSEWFLGPLSKLWSDYLPEDAVATVRHAGWYSVSVEPGLRVISVNTQWADKLNFWLYRNLTDPAGQLVWLEKELAKAEANKERVFLIGHFPPGQNDRSQSPKVLLGWNEGLSALIDKYSDVVIAQMYGHTHVDSFRVFRDVATGKQARGVAFSSSAATPYSNHNPGVRLFLYNRTDDFALIDHRTYYFNLSQANIEGKLTWKEEYSARTAYGLPDLRPESWLRLSERFLTDNALFDRFNLHYHTSHPSGLCRGTCKTNQICALQHVLWDHYQQCVNSAAADDRHVFFP